MTTITHQLPSPSISIIIPVYNTERYLKECIDSVISQRQDTNLEIILVNDDSPDRCQEIIDNYVERFPFVHGVSQTHGRQGKARNAGMQQAKAEYVLFLDSDDMLTAGALLHFFDLAEQHRSDCVVGVARSFQGLRRWINENHRNYRKEIINTSLEKTPYLLEDTSSCNKLYRRSFLLDNNIRFTEDTFCEDVAFVNHVYLIADRITISPRIIHEYRGRKAVDGPSGTQTFSDRRVRQCSAIFNKSLQMYDGTVQPFLYEKLCSKVVKVTCQQFRRFPGFPHGESRLYPEIQETLRRCSVKVIADNAQHYTIPLLMIREGYFVHASALLNYGAITPVMEDFFLQLSQNNPDAMADLLKVNVCKNVETIDRVISHGGKKNPIFVGKRILQRIGHDISQLKNDLYQFFVFTARLIVGKYRISHSPSLKRKITKVMRQRVTGLIWKCGFYTLRPLLLRRPSRHVWLIGEREGRGFAESGCAFYRYCSEVLRLEHVHYVLDRKKPIPEDIENRRFVIRKGSVRHFLLLLQTECFIFTNNELDVAPFLPPRRGKLPIKTVFLNHGVTYYNPGVYLRGIANRFDMILAVSEEEKQQKIDDWSLTDSGKVKVTGFPIFDPLASFTVKQEIVFCPTWRNQLDDLTEEEFQESIYFKEIASFLCDSQLHDFLKQYSIRLTFRCHFRMASLLHLFQTDLPSSISIEHHDSKRSLQNCLKDARLLITDYSSILWDMAFMKKPVIVFQFDREAFLAERGLHRFSIADSTMEFAAFVKKKDDLLRELATIAENNFLLSEGRQNTISRFFAYMDDKNSDRVYREICRILE